MFLYLRLKLQINKSFRRPYENIESWTEIKGKYKIDKLKR